MTHINEPSDQKKGEEVDPCKGVVVAFVTPGADPINHANPTQGADGQNEFTYSTATPGVLTIKLKATVVPKECAMKKKDKISFTVDTIDGSTLAWNSSNPGGKAVVNGDTVEAEVTFTGLPSSHTAFGKKKARALLDGAIVAEATYEVFFPRDARNNPGGAAPNWFYYWSQLLSWNNLQYSGSSGSTTMAEVRAMTSWSYTSAPSKQSITVYNEVLTKTRAYGYGVEVSGIDNFMSTCMHESKHVDQIARADRLVPSQRCWRYGWSWGQRTHNHWAPGRDGLWGNPGIATASVAEVPPLEPGQPGSDDVSLHLADYPARFSGRAGPIGNWPEPWPLPVSTWPLFPVEIEAVQYADGTVPEHHYAAQDWADPGKNHKTPLKWDD
jgi:hypothetical protein